MPSKAAPMKPATKAKLLVRAAEYLEFEAREMKAESIGRWAGKYIAAARSLRLIAKEMR